MFRKLFNREERNSVQMSPVTPTQEFLLDKLYGVEKQLSDVREYLNIQYSERKLEKITDEKENV